MRIKLMSMCATVFVVLALLDATRGGKISVVIALSGVVCAVLSLHDRG